VGVRGEESQDYTTLRTMCLAWEDSELLNIGLESAYLGKACV
jgi:hypothetical protein